MRVLIKKVGISTFNPETDEITNFWLIGKLQNGKEIQILDNVPYDLRNSVNKEIECLLFISLSGIPVDDLTIDEPKNSIIRGVYLGKYKIPESWQIPKIIKLTYDHINEFHAIQTQYGIFITTPEDIAYYSIKEGEEFVFQVINFELWALELIN